MPVFFFSDIERSSEKWEKHAEAMGQILTRHDAILTETIREYDGRIIKHTGDGFFAVFETGDPMSCAIDIQKRLALEDWSRIGDLRVRIALHAGEAEQRGGDYFGPVINRTARLLSTASGGQILLSAAVKSHCGQPAGADLIDLGIHFLPDLGEPINIFQLDHPDLAVRKFPLLRTLSGRPNNLPAQPTEFIGRDKEIDAISAMLLDPARRLINIVGPGGVGKTRLALQTGALNFERFQNGVFFIPLENLVIGSIQFLVFAVADTINFTFYSREDPRLQLINYLREKEMLLIMDNFEHLVGEAELLSDIIQQAPKIKLLVTSRERLRLKDENVYEIEGLEYPSHEADPDFEKYGAVRLFIQSGCCVQPNFTLTPEDRKALVRLFKMVAGVPLCIELAASWMHSVTCPEIVQELEKSLDFLDSTVQDLPRRHRNLRAVFEYSWELLTEKEKQIFRKSAVFSAAFTRDSVEKVCGLGLADITAMVDKSLLRRRADGRYEMFPLLRKYAEEKLGRDSMENKQLRNQHGSYFSVHFKNLYELYSQNREESFLKSVGDDAENGRQALAWLVEQNSVFEARPLINAFHSYYQAKGWFLEGERFISGIQEKLEIKHGKEPVGEPDRSYYAMILRFRGAVLKNLSRYEQARSNLQHAQRLRTESEDSEAMSILTELGTIAYLAGDYGEAHILYQKVMKHWEDAGDTRKIAEILNSLGNVCFYSEVYDEALELWGKSLKIRQELGDKRSIAATLNNLGNGNIFTGKLDKAEEYLLQSIEIRLVINDRVGLASSYNNLGLALTNKGGYEEAIKYYSQSLLIKREQGDLRSVCGTLLNMGGVYLNLKKVREARECFRECLEILTMIKNLPLLLQTVNRCAEFFMVDDNKTLALEIYTFINKSPAVGERTRENVRKMIAEFPAADADAAAKKVAQMAVEDIVREIQKNL